MDLRGVHFSGVVQLMHKGWCRGKKVAMEEKMHVPVPPSTRTCCTFGILSMEVLLPLEDLATLLLSVIDEE